MKSLEKHFRTKTSLPAINTSCAFPQDQSALDVEEVKFTISILTNMKCTG
jgi:hypothetical protein